MPICCLQHDSRSIECFLKPGDALMSGPQFAHIQSYAMKPNPAGQSVIQVVKEADREPEFSHHVEHPKPPRIVHGMNLKEVLTAHAQMLEAGAVEVKLKNGKTARRRIREDRHTLLTVVASHPNLTTQVQGDLQSQAAYDKWVDLNVRFLRAKFGDRLVSVIEHTDEAHPHLHAYILPLGDPACSAREMNPAWAAKEKAEKEAKAQGKEGKEALKIGNRAYKEAARRFQDEYHAAVGMPCGLTRTGPKRERLSREQWKERKEEARRNAERLHALEVGESKLEAEARAIVAEVVEERHKIAAELLSEKKAAEREKKRALAVTKAAEAEAEAIQEAAQAEARALMAAAQIEAEAIKKEARNSAQALKVEAQAIREEARLLKKTAEQEALKIESGAKEAVQTAVDAETEKLRDARRSAHEKWHEADKERAKLKDARHRLALTQRSFLARGILLAIRLVIGVLEGSVRWGSQEEKCEIDDRKLRLEVRNLGVSETILRWVVETVSMIFGMKKTEAELAAISEQAEQFEAAEEERPKPESVEEKPTEAVRQAPEVDLDWGPSP